MTIVDGFQVRITTVDAAEASGRKLKLANPMLHIEIYDADKVRTLLGYKPNESRAAFGRQPASTIPLCVLAPVLRQNLTSPLIQPCAVHQAFTKEL